MQKSRLFEIIYILLDQKTVTARYLAERFEVSVRTIYRDVDALSAAGIPIYANPGKGGGICLMDHFVLNKSVLTEREQREILMGLQSINAVKAVEVEPILNKLSALFRKENENWIDVDFSNWSPASKESQNFETLKDAILRRHIIGFDYFSSVGEKTERIIEPYKLLFKGQGWYVYGYCHQRADFRIFKLSRIKALQIFNKAFIRKQLPDRIIDSPELPKSLIEVVLKFKEALAYRVFDEFDPQGIQKSADGGYLVSLWVPDDDWIYGYLLSYGAAVEVLHPEQIRRKFVQQVSALSSLYGL